MSLKFLALASVALSFAAGSAFAHHSFAMFDHNKTNEVAGTVAELEWINPHAWLHITGMDSNGKAVRWSFEMGGTGQLTRDRWQRDTLKPGDKVTVGYHPLKDGSFGGQFLTVTFADGRTVCQGGAGNTPCEVGKPTAE